MVKSDLKSIENAVRSLATADLVEFRRWFAAFDGDAWDEQIERDARSGKLEALAAEAIEDHASGARSLPVEVQALARQNFERLKTHRIRRCNSSPLVMDDFAASALGCSIVRWACRSTAAFTGFGLGHMRNTTSCSGGDRGCFGGTSACCARNVVPSR